MSDTTIFAFAAGSTEGRIVPVGWAPADGAYVFALGSDAPGVTGRLAVGDGVTVSQAGDYPAACLRLRARTRGPAAMPDGYWWEAAMIIGGTPELVLRVDAGERRDYTDLGWEVSGTGSVGFSLVLRGPAAGVAEVEIPAFYIDALSFTGTPADDVRTYNRLPDPGGTPYEARADDPIQIDVFPASTDPATITVTVDGAVAYAAGAFTPAFAGARSAAAVGDSLRLTIDPLGVWGDGAAVAVVLSTSAGGDTPIAWSFVAERTSGPQITSVVPFGLKNVRVTFDEAALAGDASAAGAALNPAGYAITRAPGVIAAAVTVVAVAAAVGNAYDLATDVELTPGAAYTLSIVGVRDAYGNATEPTSPGGELAFVAWRPPVPPGRDFTLYELFPQKMHDEDLTGELASLCAVLQDPIDLLLYEIDSFQDITDPDLAPEQYVDAMLKDLGNPFTFALTLTQKRTLAKLLVPIYKQKGTAPGIVNAIRLFTGLVVEHVAVGWGAALDAPGSTLGTTSAPGSGGLVLGSSAGIDPFAFKIVTSATLSAAQLDEMTKIVLYMMRGECGFLGIVQGAPAPEAGAGTLGENAVLGGVTSPGGLVVPGSFVLH